MRPTLFTVRTESTAPNYSTTPEGIALCFKVKLRQLEAEPWTDAHIPRTDKPVAFIPRAKGRARARIIRQGWDPNSFTIRF